MNPGKTACALLTSLFLGAAIGAPTTVATLTLGVDTAGMGVDPALGKVYVSNYGSGTLSIVDLETATLAATIPVGRNPRRLLVNAAMHRVYVVNDTSPGSLTVFDGRNFSIVATIPVGNRPRALAADFLNREVYVCNTASNTVSIVDVDSNAVVATVPVAASPGAPSVHHRLGKIYIASIGGDTVSVVDRGTRTAKTIAVGRSPASTYVAERIDVVLVNNVDDRTVSVIDANTDTVVKTLPSGAGTGANTISGSGVFRRAYLPNATDGTLTIIDTETLTVARTLAVGLTPVHAIADGDGGDVYVVNQGGNSVTVLDGSLETVAASFAVGTSPWRIGSANDRVFVLNQNGDAADSITLATKQNSLPGTAVATEFHHAEFDHYFHSASDIETRLLEDGLFGNAWNRTFHFWRVWMEEGAGRVPVCRFFSTGFAPRSSHFFTPYASECTGLQAGTAWLYEGIVYGTALPESATGSCPSGTVPLYRLYNDGMGGAPNHRYTADRATRDAMRTAGWVPEGFGADIAFACTPPLVHR